MTRPKTSPTIYDVARLANVSEATVSYVLAGRRSGKSRISEETRRLVLAAVAELGYAANQSARSLSKRRTERVFLVLPRLGPPFFEALSRDVQRIAARHGHTVILAVAGAPDEEAHILDQLRRRLADAAVIVFPNHMAESELVQLSQMGLSILAFSNHLQPRGFDVVRGPEDDACAQVFDILHQRGHRRVALLGNANLRAPSDMLTIYQDLFAKGGRPIDPELFCNGVETREEAYRCARGLLQRPDRPTAILTTADAIAVSALWAAIGLGFRTPDDVAIVGAGNVPETEITLPPLTTIGPTSLDFEPMVEQLFARMRGEGPAEGRIIVHPRSLILRGSV